MRPLRICHLTTFYPPHNFGGDGIGIQRLVRGLAKRGHHNTVVHDVDAYRSLAHGDEPTSSDEPENVEVVPLESGAGTLGPALVQQCGTPVLTRRRIARVLREGDFDVINYHNISLIGGPGLLKLGRATKLYLAHEHWLVCASHVLWRHGRERCDGQECLRCVLSYKRPPQLWRYTGALGRAARHVDAFVAMSEFSRDKHREFGFGPEMQVLPYFLPDPGPDEAPRFPPTDASPHPRPYFLFVGRLELIKGLDDVIPLFRELEGADLLIAGDGEHRAELERLAAGMPNVRFLGRIPPEELTRIYRHALALVVPSICFETFGIILIEAFRSGTPVVARRLGPFPEIIARAGSGELFGDERELLEVLRRLLADPGLRERHVSSGWRAFVDNWSESAVVPRYLEIVRGAAERRRDTRVLAALAP